jgi:hypothetical protein
MTSERENPFYIRSACWKCLPEKMMKKRLLLCSPIILLILGTAFYSHQLIQARADAAGGKTLVLYDASSGAIPSESLMDFTDFPPGAASLSYADGAALMDTTVQGSDTFAGWVSGQATVPGFPILDRTARFQVNFTLQVLSEAHTRDHRAGFSVIILDKDAKGIELSFWENEIWVQNDDRTGSLFTHGEGIAYPTTDWTAYQASIVGDTYTLTANSQPILSGPVRDYSNFDGFPDPYETPNFLFLGDDSTAAQSQIRLHFASVTGAEPVLPTITNTSTNNSQPAFTFTPLPSVTPTPEGNVFEICSSGWIFLSMAVGSVILRNRSRRQ